jgi:hypothetical protein
MRERPFTTSRSTPKQWMRMLPPAMPRPSCITLPSIGEGRLREEVCTRRIEELSAELTSLEARVRILPRRYRRVSRASRCP